jgi:hypothetical protein
VEAEAESESVSEHEEEAKWWRTSHGCMRIEDKASSPTWDDGDRRQPVPASSQKLVWSPRGDRLHSGHTRARDRQQR